MKQPNQRDLQAENRRNQLLELALALFAGRGVENVSIKDLAAQAGIAQGLIYYYFESKDALLEAIFQQYNPFPHIQAIIQGIYGLPAQDGLLQFVNSLAAFLPGRRNIFRIMLGELISPRTSILAQATPFQLETIGMLSQYFQERIDAGELRPHSPAISAQMIVSSFLISLMADQPLDQFGPQLVETLLDGLRAS